MVKVNEVEANGIIVRYDLCQADKNNINIIWCQCEQRGCIGCAFNGINKNKKD